MSDYLEIARDIRAKLDSLEVIDEKKTQAIQRNENDLIKADSLRQAELERERIEAIPGVQEKVETIPAVQALNWIADIPGVRKAAIAFNQSLFDIGAHTYNLAAIPMNTLGRLFGYNPGFSGERFMKGIAGEWSGAEPRFEYEKSAWGTYAPPGGEWSWENLDLPSDTTDLEKK